MEFVREDAEEELLARALYCTDEVVDSTLSDKLPLDGEEYLRKVIKEAKSLQSVAVASNAEELRRKGGINYYSERLKANSSGKGIPSEQWQKEQVSAFSQVRTRILRHASLIESPDLPEGIKPSLHKLPKDEQGWCTYCLGQSFWSKVKSARENESMEEEDCPGYEDEGVGTEDRSATEGKYPLTSLIVQLRQPQVTSLLEYHSDWAEALGHINMHQGLWVYALMSRLEKPLHPDATSALRTLAYICSSQRQAIIASSSKSTKSDVGKIVPHLNLIICLVSNYFGQKDLSD